MLMKVRTYQQSDQDIIFSRRSTLYDCARLILTVSRKSDGIPIKIVSKYIKFKTEWENLIPNVGTDAGIDLTVK
jgi:hypothetical protein